MKKQIKITLILCILYNWGFAQNKFSAPADNLNVKLMDNYCGTWKWENDNSAFTLILKKRQIAANVYLLVGWYRYIKNGTLVVDNLNKTDSVKYSGLSGYAVNGNDTLNISFNDITRYKVKNGNIYFVNGDQNKISIRLDVGEGRTSEHILFHAKKVYPDKLPQDFNIVLTRE